jgi:hypothetical protein
MGNAVSQYLPTKSEQVPAEEPEPESEAATIEKWRLYVFDFLKNVANRPGDVEEIGSISDILDNYRPEFEKSWEDGAVNTALRETEANADLWPPLERASKFLARLHNRGNLTEAELEKLKFANTLLLAPLNCRVQDRTQYNYTPLDFNPDGGVTHVRVLHLLSARGEALQCRMEHVDLASASFIALSYEWGKPDRLFWIEVVDASGKEMGIIPITDNLHSALCNIRDSSAVTMRSFWIDQISINQDDRTERGHQVSLMGKIYTTATQVVSYLGPQDVYDEDALKLLEQISGQFKHIYDTPMLHDNRPSLRQLWRVRERIPEKLQFRDKSLESAWQGLIEIVYGPWTRRLWMVQEVSPRT